ncbi:GHKL domain-containing protein [Heliobacterium undosum]|uniref:GHKL domain-containing protein n=1 Tax=Heliomicrobium undosum TaxID=121734 RepID=A0A845L8F0_9FIRM|nr:GHKL domain-containing protein [Heliomicrobium undosum]MZP31305.1 GHKL domain-containing protein [Heliomicrobium undosum]
MSDTQENGSELNKRKKELEGLLRGVLIYVAFLLFLVVFIFSFDSGIGPLSGLEPLPEISQYTPFIVVIALAGLLFLIVKTQRLQRILIDTMEQNQQLDSARRTMQVYRNNQHEFLNQLSVIYGFVQLNKPELALEYIRSYNIRFRQGMNVTKITRPEISAILVNKMTSDIGETVTFRLDIHDDLAGLPLSPSDAVSVFGNLLQNALEEVEGYEEEKRLIEVECAVQDGLYRIRISNYGFIDEQVLDKIFDYGFSTRKKEISGVGLALVKKIVNRYNGTVTVSQREKMVHFVVEVPEKGKG